MDRPSSSVRDQVLRPLEESGLARFHWKTWLTAGMGFFTDAYDLFIIGVVTTLLTPLWHLTTLDLMLLNSTALFAAVVGALVFGRLMDRLGRKTIYGIEAILLTGGAILSALAPNVWLLILFRFIVGVGIGGDYPMSGIIMSEYSNRKRRGFLVNAVFAMQGFGLLIGPAVAALLLASGVPDATIWRLMLGFGAIPAAVVIWLRRSIAETPHFMLGARGDATGAAQVVEHLTAAKPAAAPNEIKPLPGSARVLFTNGRFLLTLVGTAFSWMFLDMAFYGNSVSSSLVMKALSPTGTLLQHTVTSMLIFLVAALPGYWISALTIDRLGRKFIQIMGFAAMAIAYGILWLVPNIAANTGEFLLVYAISYFFIEFGPNSTTFVFPSEVFPVTVRGLGFGISASAGKFGAAVAAFLFPVLLIQLHLSGTMGLLAGISAAGALLTALALRESKGLTLREASQEALLETPAWGDGAATRVGS
ncbi:MAG: MFS transporter [Firmicutes bacterium]|nr:MFS transporter [Bacillota bacterium]